jgi:hypothetical protein
VFGCSINYSENHLVRRERKEGEDLKKGFFNLFMCPVESLNKNVVLDHNPTLPGAEFWSKTTSNHA